MGRSIVRALRSSGHRCAAFRQTIVKGNLKDWFAFEVQELELLQDVKTRWDSVYLMISRLGELQPVRYYYCVHKSSAHDSCLPG